MNCKHNEVVPVGFPKVSPCPGKYNMAGDRKCDPSIPHCPICGEAFVEGTK